MPRPALSARRALVAALLFSWTHAYATPARAADGELDPSFSNNGWTVSAPTSMSGPFPKVSRLGRADRLYTLAERAEADGKPSLYRVTFTGVPGGVVGVDHEFLGFPGPGQPLAPEILEAVDAAPSLFADAWYFLFMIQRAGEPAYLGVGAENFETPGNFDYKDDFEAVAVAGGSQEPVGLTSVEEETGGGPVTRAVAAVNESSGASSFAVLRRFGADVGTVPLARLWPNGAPYVAFAGAVAAGVTTDRRGRILVFGRLDDLAWLARLLPNGDLDTSFDGDGQLVLPLAAVAGSDRYAVHRLSVDGRGAIYLLGSRTDGDGFGNMVLAKLDDSGQPVASFGGDGFVGLPDGDLVAGMAMQSDGKIVLAGQRGDAQRPGVPTPDLVGSLLVERFLPTGALDPTFGTAGETVVDLGRLDPPQDGAIDVQLQGGRAVVYGFSSDATSFGLLFARFQSSLIFADSFDLGSLANWF